MDTELTSKLKSPWAIACYAGIAAVALWFAFKKTSGNPTDKTLQSKKDNQKITVLPKPKNSDEDYHIFRGFIPSNLGDVSLRKVVWDHEHDLQSKGTNTFIWCDGVWSSIVFDDSFVITDDTFIRAPACTTYIKKTADNSHFNSMDRAFPLLGFVKND